MSIPEWIVWGMLWLWLVLAYPLWLVASLVAIPVSLAGFGGEAVGVVDSRSGKVGGGGWGNGLVEVSVYGFPMHWKGPWMHPMVYFSSSKVAFCRLAAHFIGGPRSRGASIVVAVLLPLVVAYMQKEPRFLFAYVVMGALGCWGAFGARVWEVEGRRVRALLLRALEALGREKSIAKLLPPGISHVLDEVGEGRVEGWGGKGMEWLHRVEDEEKELLEERWRRLGSGQHEVGAPGGAPCRRLLESVLVAKGFIEVAGRVSGWLVQERSGGDGVWGLDGDVGLVVQVVEKLESVLRQVAKIADEGEKRGRSAPKSDILALCTPILTLSLHPQLPQLPHSLPPTLQPPPGFPQFPLLTPGSPPHLATLPSDPITTHASSLHVPFHRLLAAKHLWKTATHIASTSPDAAKEIAATVARMSLTLQSIIAATQFHSTHQQLRHSVVHLNKALDSRILQPLLHILPPGRAEKLVKAALGVVKEMD